MIPTTRAKRLQDSVVGQGGFCGGIWCHPKATRQRFDAFRRPGSKRTHHSKSGSESNL